MSLSKQWYFYAVQRCRHLRKEEIRFTFFPQKARVESQVQPEVYLDPFCSFFSPRLSEDLFLSLSLAGRKWLTDARKKDRKKPLELRMTDWDHQNNKSRITAAKAKQAAITSYTAKQMHWRKFEKKNISLSSDVYIRTDEKTTATIQVWASKSEWHLGHRAGSP